MALTLSEDDRRVVAVWAADCAERTLSLFETKAPGDLRPREAIDGVRAFARGELRIGPARALSVAAHAAARDVDDAAAVAAARAAGHAAGTAHMASHARGVPAYTGKARALARPDDPTAASDEVRWAVEHASPAVRDALLRLPNPVRAGGQLGALIDELHQRLTRRKDGAYMELGNFSVSLSVKDLDASRRFYEKLGFVAFGGEPSENWLILKNGDHVIGLFQGMFEKNTLTFNPGWDNNANTLPSFTDIRDLQRQLKAQGVDFVTEVDASSTGPGSFIVVDPDGNPILVDQHV